MLDEQKDQDDKKVEQPKPETPKDKREKSTPGFHFDDWAAI